MILLETTDNGTHKEVLALAPMCGIGCRGFAINRKDIEDILTLNDKGIREYLQHLTTRLLPLKR